MLLRYVVAKIFLLKTVLAQLSLVRVSIKTLFVGAGLMIQSMVKQTE